MLNVVNLYFRRGNRSRNSRRMGKLIIFFLYLCAILLEFIFLRKTAGIFNEYVTAALGLILTSGTTVLVTIYFLKN